jgi:transcriptional regulator with XRE-family HTH domain
MALNERGDWPIWMRDLGRQLRRVREFLGLSQDQVARLAGVSQGAVSRLEAGRGLATPMLIVLKVHLVLARALEQLDPALIDDQMRESLALGGLVSSAPRNGDREMPITKDPELEELVQLYRALPERQRRTLVAVVRATAGSLAKAAIGSIPSKAEA